MMSDMDVCPEINKRLLSRRAVLALTSGAIMLPPDPAAAGPFRKRIAVGAIRWDAWEAEGSKVLDSVENTLGPRKYWERAPFCGTPSQNESISFSRCDTQAAMDDEIGFASRAGLAYWAYCWYGASNPMMNAWAHHQSSAHREAIRWCLLLQFSRLGGPAGFSMAQREYIGYLKQSNYQCVIGSRPLIYIYFDQVAHLQSEWGGNWDTLRTALSDFAEACLQAGLSRPYLVVMRGAPAGAAETAKQISADAISNYIARVPSGAASPYSALDTLTRAYWLEMASTGLAIVPICMTGWDTRPRQERPPSWEMPQRSTGEPKPYVAAGSPSQIGAHIRAGVDFVSGHSATCPAETLLVYSWDECDEGGSPLVPHWSDNGTEHEILDGVQAALTAR